MGMALVLNPATVVSGMVHDEAFDDYENSVSYVKCYISHYYIEDVDKKKLALTPD